MSSLRFSRLLDLDEVCSWPEPEILAMTEDERQNYDRKKAAILYCAQGLARKEITRLTGINCSYLYYLIHRCTTLDSDDHPYGFRALVKWNQCCSNRRSSLEKLEVGKPLPGALAALFARYPKLEETMRTVIVKKIQPGAQFPDPRLTWAQAHEIFLKECTALGICPPSYPFCSDSLGSHALKAWGKREQANKEKNNSGRKENEVGHAPATRVYERVEIDGHFIDVNWTLEIPSLNGDDPIYLKVTRLWIIALLEYFSSAALGYSIALGRNYNFSDVACAVQSCLVPWKPRKLTISTIAYKPGECLPSAIPELAFICFDELWLDNAKSQLSDGFLTMLERSVNAVPVFGPKAAPNVRPKIEGFFDLVEEAGVHSLRGTTGSSPRDPRKAKPIDDPFIPSLDIVLDLVDLLVARYNASPAPGKNISRIEVLKRAVEREVNVIRRIPQAERENVMKYHINEVGRIGQDKGRPILRWRNARYDGPGLHARPNLIGKKVLIRAQKDLRTIEIVLLDDGTPLGTLLVERRWRGKPNTVAGRKVIRRLMTQNGFVRNAADVPLAAREYLEKEVRQKKRAHRALAILAQEQESRDLANEALEAEDRMSDLTNHGVSTARPQPRAHDAESDDLDTLIKSLGSAYR
jgi:putative transposase